MTRRSTLALCAVALAAALLAPVLAGADERQHSVLPGDVMLEIYAGSPALALSEFRGRLAAANEAAALAAAHGALGTEGGVGTP